MAAYFVDSSALGKRYVAESGSTWLRRLLDPAFGGTVYIARTTSVEVIAAITRRERGGSLTAADAATARSQFRTDLANEYQVVELTESVANQAMLMAEKHGLRGYDAVQLAAALELNARRTTAGLAALTLVSADKELNAAAVTEGLIVDDPNMHR